MSVSMSRLTKSDFLSPVRASIDFYIFNIDKDSIE